jgi:mercuric reductase
MWTSTRDAVHAARRSASRRATADGPSAPSLPLHHASAARRFAGIRGEARLDDWAALVAQKDELVANLRQTKYIDLLSWYDGITYLEGMAALTPQGVRVNGELVRAPKVIFTTGARPAVPPIRGIESVAFLTSTTALSLERLPRSLLVIGGGYVGGELAQLFARAGVRVTLVFRSRLLPGAEPEISAALENVFRHEGIAVHGGVDYVEIRQTGRGIALDALEAGAPVTLEAEQGLVATGRRPNTEGLELERARRVGVSVSHDRRGTEACGAGLHEGCDEALLLRGVTRVGGQPTWNERA